MSIRQISTPIRPTMLLVEAGLSLRLFVLCAVNETQRDQRIDRVSSLSFSNDFSYSEEMSHSDHCSPQLCLEELGNTIECKLHIAMRS